MHNKRHIADEIARATAGKAYRRALVSDASLAAGVEAARNPDACPRDLRACLNTDTTTIGAYIDSLGAAPEPGSEDDAEDDRACAEENEKLFAASRAALARVRALRRADALLIIDDDSAKLTSRFEAIAAAAARIDALADALTATVRTALGVVHHALSARVQRAGRAAALPALRWPTESDCLT